MNKLLHTRHFQPEHIYIGIYLSFLLHITSRLDYCNAVSHQTSAANLHALHCSRRWTHVFGLSCGSKKLLITGYSILLFMNPLNFKYLQVPAVLFYSFPTASKSKRTKHYCTRQIEYNSNSD